MSPRRPRIAVDRPAESGTCVGIGKSRQAGYGSFGATPDLTRDSVDRVERTELLIEARRSTDEVVFTLAGEIDMLTVTRLSAMVTEAIAESPNRIVLDMAGVTFCDSQGLGTLVVLSRKAGHGRVVLMLANVGDFLLRVLDITGLRSALVLSNDSRTG